MVSETRAPEGQAVDGRWHVAAVAVVAVATLWHGAPWLFGDRMPPGDFAGYVADLQQVRDAIFSHGRVPEWCTRCFAGTSFFNSSWRSILLSPLTWLLGPVLALKLAFLLAKAAAALGLYLLVARGFAAPAAGLVAGYALGFGAVANHQVEHLDAVLATALLPPTVWVALAGLRDGGLGRAVTLGALAAFLFANHWVYSLSVPLLVAALAWAAPWPGAAAGRDLLREPTELRRRVVWVATALLVFLVLAASTLTWLAADAEHHRLFSEAAAERQRQLYVERSPFLFLNRENVLAPWLAAHQPPGFDLPRHDAGRRYLGIVLLAVCAVGAAFGARREDATWRRGAAVAAALFGLQYWLALGPRTLLWEVATSFHASDAVMRATQWTLWAAAGACGLAALVVAWRASERSRAATRTALVGLLLLAPTVSLWNGLAFALPMFGTQRSPGHFFDTATVWLCALTGLALVAIGRRIARPRAAAACVLAIGVAVVFDFAPSRARFAGGEPLGPLRDLGERVAALPAEDGTLRVGTPIAYDPRWSYVLEQADAGYAWGWLSWQSGRFWGDYYARALYATHGPRPDGRGAIDPDAVLLRAARVRHLLVPAAMQAPEGWRVLDGSGPWALWEGPDVAPWALGFREIVWREVPGRADAAVASRALRANRLLVSPPEVPSDGEADAEVAALRARAGAARRVPAPPPFAVSWRREAPGRVALDVDAGDAPAVVAIAEGYHPWWEATVGGRSVPVLRQSLAFLGVPVGPGVHAVTLRFVPPRVVRAATWLTGVGWLAVAALAVRGVVLRLRRDPYSR